MSDFEEWMDAEARIAILEADLRRAVKDRGKLLESVRSVARQASHGLSGLERVQLLAILRNIEVTAFETICEVEGK